MRKTLNQKAWFFVLPVFILVAFNAAIPLMTVINYSFQETFGDNIFFWEGTRWFKQILQSDRFYGALGRQFLFTFLILIIQIPLGIVVVMLDIIFNFPPSHSMSIILCLPALLTFKILTAIPLFEKLTNSGLIPI